MKHNKDKIAEILNQLANAADKCMEIVSDSDTTLAQAVKASELIGDAAEILEQLDALTPW